MTFGASTFVYYSPFSPNPSSKNSLDSSDKIGAMFLVNHSQTFSKTLTHQGIEWSESEREKKKKKEEDKNKAVNTFT